MFFSSCFNLTQFLLLPYIINYSCPNVPEELGFLVLPLEKNGLQEKAYWLLQALSKPTIFRIHKIIFLELDHFLYCLFGDWKMIYAWDLAGLFCPRKMPQDRGQTLLPAVVCSKDQETEAVSGPVFAVETVCPLVLPMWFPSSVLTMFLKSCWFCDSFSYRGFKQLQSLHHMRIKPNEGSPSVYGLTSFYALLWAVSSYCFSHYFTEEHLTAYAFNLKNTSLCHHLNHGLCLMALTSNFQYSTAAQKTKEPLLMPGKSGECVFENG